MMRSTLSAPASADSDVNDNAQSVSAMRIVPRVPTHAPSVGILSQLMPLGGQNQRRGLRWQGTNREAVKA